MRWSTRGSLKSAASDVDTSPTTDLSAAGPSKEAEAEFSRVAPGEQIRAVANALERNGVTCKVVGSAEEAREAFDESRHRLECKARSA